MHRRHADVGAVQASFSSDQKFLDTVGADTATDVLDSMVDASMLVVVIEGRGSRG